MEKIFSDKKIILPVVIILLFLTAYYAYGGSIVGSRHDLNYVIYGNPGFDHDSKINVYNEVCVYCHTPHSAGSQIDAPLWNRLYLNGIPSFTLYNSTTMNTTPGQPAGVSLACLSCHDGTIAVDSVINPPNSSPGSAPFHAVMAVGTVEERYTKCGGCHTPETRYFWSHDASASYLTTDLANDHPIAMDYPTSAQDPAFNIPPDIQKGWSDVRLFNGKVECASCHNVHDPDIQPFLRKSNSGSVLCRTCHLK